MGQRLCVASVALLAMGAYGALGSTTPAAFACGTGSVTFSSTNAEQCYEVPAGVTSLAVTAVGARGGNSDAEGGFGAVVHGVVPVTPGSTLYVEVGSNGCAAPNHGCPASFG